MKTGIRDIQATYIIIYLNFTLQVLTLTLSKLTIHVPEALIPNLSSGFATDNPGVSLSTKNDVIPR